MIKNLCSLRFVFIVPIVLSHLPCLSGNPYVLSASNAAVGFFFMLSGFVLAHAYGSSVEDGTFSLSRFMLRQLRKLYPLYLLCMLVFVVINFKYIDTAEAGRILLACCMVQSWIPDIDYYFAGNSVSWFLSTLFSIYLTFPLLQRFISRLTFRRLALFSLLLAAVYLGAAFFVPPGRANDIVYIHPLSRLADFTLGLCLYRFYAETKQNRQLRHPLRCAVAVVLAYACVVALSVHADIRLQAAALYWLPNALAIGCFAAIDTDRNALCRQLQRPVLMFLGRNTFAIFLTHCLIINILVRLAMRWGLA